MFSCLLHDTLFNWLVESATGVDADSPQVGSLHPATMEIESDAPDAIVHYTVE